MRDEQNKQVESSTVILYISLFIFIFISYTFIVGTIQQR